MPDVSVVIPTHDRRRLLGQTLRSVLAQRGVEVEVVVVDDGSSDGTAEAVAALGDRRVRLLRQQRPRGVASARNLGAAAAQAAWVAFLDDDDLWAPDKLARQLGRAQAEGRDWVYAGAVEVDGAGRLLGGSPPPSPEALLAELRRRNPMPAGSSNVVVRAALLTEVGGFDPALRHLADWDLWLRLARRGRPAWVAAPLVAYRIHPAQATMDTTGMAAEARVLAARHGADPAAVHRWAAWSQLRAGRRRAAVAAYAAAVRTGDLASLARMAVALLSPQPTQVPRPWRRAAAAQDWHLAARAWLEELATAERARS
jgi:glycosyltransferase involved in cell wall biosynthesis